MKGAKAFFSTFILALFTYLLLTFAAGQSSFNHPLLWSREELILGASVSLLTAAATSHILCRKDNYRMANPLRWLIILVYTIPLFWEMVKANLDVAYRVITGKIEPGIVKIKPKLKEDISLTFLANSITLTPGTLTVDVDDEKSEMYIHWIKVRDKPTKNIAGRFIRWIRRFAE